MDNSSPETTEPQLKESRRPEIQHRVIEKRSELQVKKPQSPLTDIHQEARDKVAQAIVRERLRNEVTKAKDKATQAELSAKEATELSLKDPLTSMYNRRYFEDYMSRQIELLERDSTKRTFFVISDIDDFGLFNKNYGTDIGDSVLRETGSAYNKSLRSSDVAARWGGEELVSTFDFDTTQSGTMPLNEYLLPLERIKDKLKEIKIHDSDGKEIPETITSSFGVTKMIPGEKFETFMARASTAMRFAKMLGKDRIVSITPTESNNTFLMQDMESGEEYVYSKEEDGTEYLTNNHLGKNNEQEHFTVAKNTDGKPYLKRLGN
ncbi:MAG TPA: GGDEF domain-containing protein [Candidatus Levybacteria bacterium]|nr:GGDEF domain-containing protein [Candidatus Levybacteria bacterium]